MDRDSIASSPWSLTLGLYATFSLRDMCGNRAMFWNTYPTSLSSMGMSVTSIPSTYTLPSVGLHMPEITLISVVFPHPDGPRMVTYSPLLISRLMSLTA